MFGLARVIGAVRAGSDPDELDDLVLLAAPLNMHDGNVNY